MINVMCHLTWCDQVAVVVLVVKLPPVEIPSCQHHPAALIWEIRRVHPGHTGVQTMKIGNWVGRLESAFREGGDGG